MVGRHVSRNFSDWHSIHTLSCPAQVLVKMSTRDRCLFFGTGLASVILVYSVIRHLRSLPAGTGMSELIKNEPKKLENGNRILTSQ